MSALISKSAHAGNQIEVTIGNGNWGAFQRVPRVARAGGAAVKSETIHSSIPSRPSKPPLCLAGRHERSIFRTRYAGTNTEV
jgi:hypothetical protein